MRDVYIGGLRSVLIVDDDFPTLDEVLDDDFSFSSEDNSKAWLKNRKLMRETLQLFRKAEQPLIVDMHDGSNIPDDKEVDFATHLHQSDLLILDYNLDRGIDHGEKAIRIIRELARNPHFNVVVINTQKDIATVFAEIVLSLTIAKVDLQEGDDEFLELVQDKLDVRDVEWNEIQSMVHSDPSLFVEACREWNCGVKTRDFSSTVFVPFDKKCDRSGLSVAQRRRLLEHLCYEYQKVVEPKLSSEPIAGLSYASIASGVKWIKADNFFIAFAHKRDDDNLLKVAEEALVSWRPHPARMILSKLRTEIEENGVTVQDAVLSAKSASALWYKEALSAEAEERAVKIEELTKRQSEMLFSRVLPNVKHYAQQLLISDDLDMDANDKSAIDACKLHFGIDLQDSETKKKAADEHNILISSKPPEGWHLQTGHVLQIEEQYWICLSPSCDLVPRSESDREATYGKEVMPFLAVKLQDAPDNTRGKVLDGRFVHMMIDGEPRRFAINKAKDHASRKLWHTLFAQKLGKFDTSKMELSVSHLSGGENGLEVKTTTARVVGHLRYEYALSLAQQLAQFVSRIGLDFVKL